MLMLQGERATVPICTAAAAEIKSVLGDRLGATLVEAAIGDGNATPTSSK